jgi:four helix bundle protein
MGSFKDLVVWQLAMDLVVVIYSLLRKIPIEERFGLCDQMRRSVISIPSNIAEGQARATRKDFSHFLTIASASLSELETQVLICNRVDYCSEKDIQAALSLIGQLRSKMNALQKSIRLGSSTNNSTVRC